MEVRPRIIPSLLIMDGQLVKGSQFKNHVYLGDPLNAVKIFNDMQVDELCICEIGEKKINQSLLEKIASRAFMPLTYGGNICSLEESKKLFSMGFERLILNSLFYNNPATIQQIVSNFGSSSVSISLDYKYNLFKGLNIFSNGGNTKKADTINQLIDKAKDLNIGEIIFQCIDKEGSRSRADLLPLNSCIFLRYE